MNKHAATFLIITLGQPGLIATFNLFMVIMGAIDPREFFSSGLSGIDSLLSLPSLYLIVCAPFGAVIVWQDMKKEQDEKKGRRR